MSRGNFRNIFVLTGAGISAESGVKTFRDANGLWENHRIEDVATPEAYARDPALVQQFYNLRRAQLKTVQPNAAHLALASFEKNFKGEFNLVTQNVDDLHERAGSRKLIHMHGELSRVWCIACDAKWPHREEVSLDHFCKECGARGRVRPDIVWFGEMPYQMDWIEEALGSCDLFVAIGTSGQVYPAAGFVALTRPMCWKVEINPEATPVSRYFDERIEGKAAEAVPGYLERLGALPL